jgi:hypothetical protein
MTMMPTVEGKETSKRIYDWLIVYDDHSQFTITTNNPALAIQLSDWKRKGLTAVIRLQEIKSEEETP